MLRRSLSICGLLLASLLLHAGAAYGAPGDPEAGSPSEGIYELPLEKGREDAAPGSGGTTAPEGGGGESGGGTSQGSEGGEEEGSSNYRSENNFGSSSQVPGAGDAPVSSDGAGAGGAGGVNGAGAGGDADSGDAAGGAGVATTEVEQTGAEVPDTGNTSVAGNLALLAAILVLAAAVGIIARRRLRTRQRPT